MPDRLMLIVSTSSYRTVDFVAAARRLQVELEVASDRCHVLAEEWPEGAFPVELTRPEEAVAALVQRGRERAINGVLGTDDLTATIAARVASALGVPHNSPISAERARHKRLQRECLCEAGTRDRRIQVPAFLTADIHDDPRALAGRVPYPCILKPVALSASRGVIRADDPEAFELAFRRIQRLLESPDILVRRDAAHTGLLIETFVPGREYALEALLEKGKLTPLALFDKPDPLDGPFFTETIYVTPSRLDPSTQGTIVDAVSAAAHAMGLREGPVHAEVRVNGSGVWILEVAARTIGGLCSRTLRFGAGVSLEELVIASAVGRGPSLLARERTPAGVMMLALPRAGVYRGVQGVDAARAVPGIEDLVVTVAPGDHFLPLPEGSGYLGFLFARAETPQAVEAALRAAHALLRFDVDPILPVARPARDRG